MKGFRARIRTWWRILGIRRYRRNLDRHDRWFQKRDWSGDMSRPSQHRPDLKVRTKRLLREGDIVREPSGTRYLVSRRGWRRLGGKDEKQTDEEARK